MKNLAKLLSVLAVVAMFAPQAAEAHSRHQRLLVNNQNYCQPVNCDPSPYPYGVRAPNGSWVDGYVGPDGYPAWMGGARPGR